MSNSLFLGPMLNNAELLAIIFKMDIPQLKTPKYVPAPPGFGPLARGGGNKRPARWEDEDDRRKR